MWWKDSHCGADSPRGTVSEAATYARRGEAGEKFVHAQPLCSLINDQQDRVLRGGQIATRGS